MIHVTGVKVVREYILEVTFSDGAIKRVDVQELLWGPVFEPLKDPAFFALARLDPEIHTVTWPNSADIAPEYLYEHGQPVLPA